MLLFLVISTFVISLSKSESQSTPSSKISNYNSDLDDLKSYESTTNQMLRNLQNIECQDSLTSCSNHGICNGDKSDCICETGFTTYPYNNIPRCNYTQKKQLVAFLCELFLGFGAGHFYSERYTVAALKLAAFLFGIYIICLFPLTAKCVNDRCDSDFMVITVSCFYYCCAIGLAFWFIYDLVMFGMNSYLDGNGQSLLAWGVQTASS